MLQRCDLETFKKGLMPQLQVKVPTVRRWLAKMAVTLTSSFLGRGWA